MKRLFAILAVVICIFSLPLITITAAPPAQRIRSCQTDIIVQADDSLHKLADKYYGDISRYSAIVTATNQRHEIDASYAKIDQAERLEPGWKLCLPVLSPVQPLPTGDGQTAGSLDEQLRHTLNQFGITPLDPGPEPDPAKVVLGQALYFDKILGGNQDIACATCHLPSQHTGDGLPLSIGTGGLKIGPDRNLGPNQGFIPRNAPEIFNRGAPGWTTMFWDSRVSGSPEAGFNTPAETVLPDGLDNVLAAQAMFPVISRAEMRGQIGGLHGRPNEVADAEDEDYSTIWAALIQRLLTVPEYVTLFQAAYPDLTTDQLGFQHAANAIAAFEIDAFTFLNSPWDNYVAGDNAAISEQVKLGALLFYGEAGCANCHSGNLFTDQLHHNIAVPQVGPGRDDEAPLDVGRFAETGQAADRFAFRTPPLRNVALTGPWMHNGAYTNLADAAILPYIDPEAALRHYDVTQLPAELRNSFQQDEVTFVDILATLDPLVQSGITLSDQEAAQLLAFLNALTDPAALDLSNTVPESVPSGLSIDH